MPVVVEGVTYWHVPEHIVEDAQGNRAANVTGQAYLEGTVDFTAATPLLIRQFDNLAPMSQLQSNTEAKLEEFWCSAPSGIIVMGGVANAFFAVPDILQLAQQAESAVTSAQAAQAAAEAAAASAAQAGGGQTGVASASNHRYWDSANATWYWIAADGTHRFGRPPVQGHVESHSDLYPEATTPPDSLKGDVWWVHPSRVNTL